jgi:hypothetical protein
MEKDFSDLFDLYLEDIDSDSVPSEFIISSKVIFISNNKELPSKVKAHTLSFTVDETEDIAYNKVIDSAKSFINDALDSTIEDTVVDKVIQDMSMQHTSVPNAEDFIKMSVIYASGLPKSMADTWVRKQD